MVGLITEKGILTVYLVEICWVAAGFAQAYTAVIEKCILKQ